MAEPSKRPPPPILEDEDELIPPPPEEYDIDTRRPPSPPYSSTLHTPSRKDSKELFSSSPRGRGLSNSGGKSEPSTPQRPGPPPIKRVLSPGTPIESTRETKSLAALTSASALSNSGSSFATAMTHNFDVVSKQVEQGIYATKRVGKVLGELARLEEEYARNLLRVLEHEYTKIQRLNEDGMRGFARRWIESLALIKELAISHSKNSAQIMADIVEPLSAFNSDSDNTKRNLMAQERKVSGEMASAADKVRKGYQTCARAILQCKETHDAKKKTSDKEKTQPARSRTSAFMSNVKKAASKVSERLTGSLEDLQSRTYQSAVQYAIDIDAANKRQDKYVASELPTIFSGMQLLEVRRLETLKKHLLKYTMVQHQALKGRAELMDKVKSTVAGIDTEQDIRGFIDDWIYEHGPPVPMGPFQYSLSSPPEDIKAGRIYGAPNSVFQTTIQRCMELQKETHPELKIPRIVSFCISGVQKLDGCKTEGIFRISADQIELEKFRERVTAGVYDLKGIDSPHMPAALLKTWLRMLAEPLIPDDLYRECLEVARYDKTPPKDIQTNIKTLFNKLDELNQLIIQAIADICNEISSPENAAVNRMNLNTLSIVFAPSFLRNPSADPIELLQNTKFETRFVSLLFEVLGGSFGVIKPSVPHPTNPRRSAEDPHIMAATLKLHTPVPTTPVPPPPNFSGASSSSALLTPSGSGGGGGGSTSLLGSSIREPSISSPTTTSPPVTPLSPGPPLLSHHQSTISSTSSSGGLNFPADIV